MRAGAWVALAGLAALACGGPAVGPANSVQSTGTGTGSPPPPALPAADPVALDIRIAFDAGRLHVRVAASRPTFDVSAWSLTRVPVERLEVRDGEGHLLRFKRNSDRVELEGAAPSTVVLDYDVAAPASPPTDQSGWATMIEPSRFRAMGEAILAQPALQFGRGPHPVSIEIRSADAPVAATSFGAGRDRGHVSKRLSIMTSSLGRTAFMAGPGGHAELDAPEGHDESAWLGYPAFDPRAVSAEIAGFRGLLNEYFKTLEPEPATALFVVDARTRGHADVIRCASGILVTLSGADPYDGPLRTWVAHALVQAWIGDRIWLGDATPGNEMANLWFHSGVTRWVAREQLARAGLLSPDEYTAELGRVLAILTTSRHASRSMKELLADTRTPGVLSLLVARGSLLATIVDARIRETTQGARSLDDVIRTLAKQAEAARGPLPESAFRDAVAAETKVPPARDEFDDVVALGRRVRIPENALGACFESREVTYDVYDRGFDVTASRAAHAIVELDPKGPAARAGLREGDVLVAADVPDRPEDTAKIDVERGGKPVTITYRPTSGTRRGQGFRKKSSLTDEACRRLSVRR